MFHNLGRLLRYRGLIQSLVARELKARYRGSVLGFFWSFINPLMLLLVYSFVFEHILNQRGLGLPHYEVFLFCGLLPWTWFSSSLLESSGVLISGGNLIKKVLFPAEVLPIVSVLANMAHFFLALPIVVFVLVLYQHWPDPMGLVWFPAVVAVQLVFTTGIAMVLAAFTVHFRDLRDILANVLMLWFFTTPIIYFYDQVEVRPYKWLFNLNPFTHLAISYQEILFFNGPFGHWKWLLGLGLGSIAVFFAGYWLFDRLRDSFVEVV